eukprot:GHVL01031292.1.p1 GENE.GHVL01031292.1~~GHVL01031292.1.p1  ORF type:complete len:1673 (+),score=501.02 GHVL01031292.1:423-5441(+)
MDAIFTVEFNPVEMADYFTELHIVTPREEIFVPVKAVTSTAILDFPDFIDFGACPVNFDNERYCLLRNISQRSTKFNITSIGDNTTVSPCNGFLDINQSCQITVTFLAKKSGPYSEQLKLTYGMGVFSFVSVTATAELLNILITPQKLHFPNTYISLQAFQTVNIQNNSNYILNFIWKNHKNEDEENRDKEMLEIELESLISENQMNQTSDIDNLSDMIEQLKMKKKGYFNHEAFSLGPIAGKIWPHSTIPITVEFEPSLASNYFIISYLKISGLENRISLDLHGQGLGPRGVLSFDKIDIGNICINTKMIFEFDIINLGDINLEWNIIKNKSTFDRFLKCQPSMGVTLPNNSQKISLIVLPEILGDFDESIICQLQSGECNPTLYVKGTSTPPKLEFEDMNIDLSRIPFGFTNRTSVTLHNRSRIEVPYDLNLIGELNKDVKLTPESGILPPKSCQNIDVEVHPLNVGSFTLPIRARMTPFHDIIAETQLNFICEAADVEIDPQSSLNFEDVFINFLTSKNIKIKNTGGVITSFLLNIDESDETEITLETVKTVIEPFETVEIQINLLPKKIGNFQKILNIMFFGKQNISLSLIGFCIGPKLSLDNYILNFGKVVCLEPVSKDLIISNISPICAYLRLFILEKKYKISKKILKILPNSSETVTLIVTADETVKIKDILVIFVEDSENITVKLICTGGGSCIKCSDDLDNVDFGFLQLNQEYAKEIILENFGQKNRKITWSLAKNETEGSKKGSDKPTFMIIPDTFIMDPKSTVSFLIYAFSKTSGDLSDVYNCNETVISKTVGGGFMGPLGCVFHSKFRANFSLPTLLVLPNIVKFCYQSNADSILIQYINLSNISQLPVTAIVDCPYPFSCNQQGIYIDIGKNVDIELTFDSSFTLDNKNSTKINKKLNILFKDNPTQITVELVGETIFPNLNLDKKEVNFGAILNETSETEKIILTNNQDGFIDFEWVFGEFATEPIEQNIYNQRSIDSQCSNLSSSKDNTPGVSDETVEVTDIFNIIPNQGRIPPGDSMCCFVTFFGYSNLKCFGNAYCKVSGGPQYEIKIMGLASDMKIQIQKSILNFGTIKYNKTSEEYFLIKNLSLVSIPFEIQSTERQFDIYPLSGILSPKSDVELCIRIYPGSPKPVRNDIIIKFAHINSKKFTVLAVSVTPGVLFANIPRMHPEIHHQLKKEAHQRLVDFLTDDNKIWDQKDAPRSRMSKRYSTTSLATPGGRSLAAIGGSLKNLNNYISDIDIEFEIDRYNMCHILKNVTDISMDIIIATYYIDFDCVVIGRSKKKTVELYNCCSERVSFKTKICPPSFIIESVNCKNIPPGDTSTIDVTADISSDTLPGIMNADWILNLKNGPSYKILLKVDCIQPTIEFSTKEIDFKTVLIGHRKTVTIRIYNFQKITVEWRFRKNNSYFNVEPTIGRLSPEGWSNLRVHFTPQKSKKKDIKSDLLFKIKDRANDQVLSVLGTIETAEISIQHNMISTSSINLGNILAHSPGGSAEFQILNLSNHSQEIYIKEFDKKWIFENRQLQRYFTVNSKYETVFLKIRNAGEPIWEEVNSEKIYQVKHLETSDDHRQFPIRIPTGLRSNVVIVGLPGDVSVTELANQMSVIHKRKIIIMDEIIDWYLNNQVSDDMKPIIDDLKETVKNKEKKKEKRIKKEKKKT